MMPYPASGGDADRAAKLNDSGLGAMNLAKGRSSPCEDEVQTRTAPPGAAAEADVPPVWKRYIDSRLKQFCTR
jgi:hypothetical protein